jgi:ATP-dependent protease ClpP protease subunit
MVAEVAPEAAGRNARRWAVKAHVDDSICEPCQKNDKKVYRNRQAAYRDYPNGKGYKKCIGARYGNDCRCVVVQRGKGGDNVADQAELINRAMTLTAKVTARDLRPPAPVNGLPFAEPERLRAQDNALYIYDAIGGWDGAKAIDVALALRDMTGPLDLHLNSPGGVIFEGAAMYNAIKAYTGGPVTAYIDGYAASAASFVALAASPYDPETDTGGVRIAKNAVMMVHDGMGLAMGTADDLRDVADLLDMLSDTIAAVYAERAGGTAEQWRETMRDGDTWYNAEQAKAAGLADVIIGEVLPAPEPGEEQATAKISLDSFKVEAPEATAVTTADTITPFDLEGFREALKGVLAT